MMRFFPSLLRRKLACPVFQMGGQHALPVREGVLRSAPGVMLGVACLALAGLGGCSSTATSCYGLSPQAGAQAPSLTSMALPSVIEIRTPSITARLDRDGILRGMRDSQDHMIANAMWSEPLDEMVGHTLTANLAQRLPGHVLFSQNDSVAVTPGAYLELSLTRFEEDASGHAVITGILSAHRADAPADQARAVPVHWVSSSSVQGGTKALLVALNSGMGALADQAVQLVSSLPPASSGQAGAVASSPEGQN